MRSGERVFLTYMEGLGFFCDLISLCPCTLKSLPYNPEDVLLETGYAEGWAGY